MTNRSLRIFISYRRDDSRNFVEKLFPWFLMRYGPENVFLDYASIPEFEDFDRFIHHKIDECDVVVSIIGPRWLELLLQRAQSDEPDYVLIEMEEAVRLDKVIAPILVDYAAPPPVTMVPQSIMPIFKRNFAELPDAVAIYQRIQDLFARIENQVEERHGRPAQVNVAMDDLFGYVSPESFDVFAAIDQMQQAHDREDWAETLNWIALIKAYGRDIPAEFELDAREIRYRQRLHDAQADRERRERALYAYQFVRKMVALGDPPDKVKKALERVWEIVPDYDPDGLGTSGVDAMARRVNGHAADTPLVPSVPESLPEPFDWCYVPSAAVSLKYDQGSYAPAGGLTIAVEPYFISKYPITNGQYQAFVKADDGYRVVAWWDYALAAQQWRADHPKASKSPHKGDDLPRTMISWYDAVAFCRWLGAQIGQAVLLPTEAQWQLAAQGTDGRLYPWGNDDPTPDRLNFKDYRGKPVSVQQYPSGASPFGVLDMSGNVQEWCLTAWHDGSDSIAAGDAVRVLRGGSWRDTTITARTTFRMKLRPSAEKDSIGFRVVALGRR